MSDYIIGGWTQNTQDSAPETFSYVMYGMITNLEGLTSGTPSAPGWSPASTPAPQAAGEVMWTYGGARCTPTGMPASDSNIEAIVDTTHSQGWAGVDFDDECSMNVANLIAAMGALQPSEQTSYTFLAGWGYNNPDASPEGAATNEAVRQIVQARVANRMVLMCYADAMWPMPDIEANVGPAIARTLAYGVPVMSLASIDSRFFLHFCFFLSDRASLN